MRTVFRVILGVIALIAVVYRFTLPRVTMRAINVRLYERQQAGPNDGSPLVITVVDANRFEFQGASYSAEGFQSLIERISLLQAFHQREFVLKVAPGSTFQAVVRGLDLVAAASTNVQNESTKKFGDPGPAITPIFDFSFIPQPPGPKP